MRLHGLLIISSTSEVHFGKIYGHIRVPHDLTQDIQGRFSILPLSKALFSGGSSTFICSIQ